MRTFSLIATMLVIFTVGLFAIDAIVSDTTPAAVAGTIQPDPTPDPLPPEWGNMPSEQSNGWPDEGPPKLAGQVLNEGTWEFKRLSPIPQRIHEYIARGTILSREGVPDMEWTETQDASANHYKRVAPHEDAIRIYTRYIPATGEWFYAKYAKDEDGNWIRIERGICTRTGPAPPQ